VELSPVEGFHEIIGADPGLPQGPAKRSDCQLLVPRDDASAVASAHDDMASTLPRLKESETFQDADRFLP
jgi:hypothetical protein